MTTQEADKVVKIWGKYLEHVYGRLNTLFFNADDFDYRIPESLLPYSKEVLEEALGLMDRYYSETNNIKGSVLMRETAFILDRFGDDDKALQDAARVFSNSQKREERISHLKEWQETWLSTQR